MIHPTAIVFCGSALVGCIVMIGAISNEKPIIQDTIPPLQTTPIWLNACRKKDPNLNECFRMTFQNMFPYLAKGIPEIGTRPFEPMHIDRVALTKGQGAVTLSGAFTNLIVHGPSNTTALYTKLDLVKNRLDIGLFIPIIKVESKYDLKGNLLLLPLVGVGDAKLYLKNVTTHVQTKIYFPKYMNETVMMANSMKVDFNLAAMRVNLDNLFNGNKVLGRTVNTFLNQNALEVVNDLKENIGENLSIIFKQIMNDAFSHMPTRLWLLDD
ncbi:protein takeout-like [Sipha flava]|uniref:Protein takeout n=1 Tax=Sipha flava TaxID=143950 RepID=A0A2S2Q590_9HEMI|nr:protein takeout-like [Sipha flava]